MSDSITYWALTLHLRSHQVTKRHRPVVLREDYDALREAAGRVACRRCGGTGIVRDADTNMGGPCPDCADLRALLKEEP